MNDNIPTAEQIQPGLRLFMGQHWDDKVIEIEVVGPIQTEPHNISYFKANYINEVLFREEEDCDLQVFPGDRGLPGFHNSDRPNQLWLTREAAEAGLIVANQWWANRHPRK